MFESAVSIVIVMFLLIAIGYACQRYGWLGDNAQTVISRLTLRVGVPGLIFSNMLSNYDRAMLLDGAVYLGVPLLIIAGMYMLAGPLARWINIPRARRGVFRSLFSLGNSVFLGMPVCRAIFGEEAVPIVLFYYLINTLFWWLVGAPAVAADGGADVRSPWQRLASPPLVACLASLALVLAGYTPPALVMTTAGYLGAAVTPLSMLFIGCTLRAMLSHGLRWQKGYGVILLARSLISPAACLPLCLLLGMPREVLGVFFVQSGMPTQTQTCLWAQEHGADAEYAAGAIALSTLLGLLTIPAYAWFLGIV